MTMKKGFRGARGLVDLRRPGRISVLVVPDRFDDGPFTPCAHIRLLRPLDHPDSGRGLDVTVADAAEVPRYRADIVATQRHAAGSAEAAAALAAHAKRTGARLLFDLDDDLLTPPADHPEAAVLASRAATVERMVRLADVVRVSTDALAARVAPLARSVQVVGNALDERIWRPPRPHGGLRAACPPPAGADRFGPVRVLCMGTATHDGDLALILPALEEIHREFAGWVAFDLIGFVQDLAPPAWMRRVAPSPHAGRSYPGFVQWITSAGPWDIGLAPLADTAFNACKSGIKALDYAALGLAVLASDVPAYRGGLASGPNGGLVANTTLDWYRALSRAIRDRAWRRTLGEGAARHLRESGTLAARADAWRAAWADVARRPVRGR